MGKIDRQVVNDITEAIWLCVILLLATTDSYAIGNISRREYFAPPVYSGYLQTETEALLFEQPIQPSISKEGLGHVKRLLSRIQEQEARFSAYSPVIAALSYEMGNVLYSMGNYLDAADAFQQSRHITKVNEGVHNLEQLHATEMLLQSHAKLEQWDKVDNDYTYLYWLSSRSGDSRRMLSTQNRLAKWKLHAYELKVGRKQFTHLMAAGKIQKKAIKSIPETITVIDAEDLLLGMAMTNYYTAVHAHGPDELDGIANNGSIGRMIALERARMNMVRDSNRNGRRILTKLVGFVCSMPEKQRNCAIAKLHLADWNTMFKRSNTAKKLYTESYNLFITHGYIGDVEQYFGQPVMLPAYDVKSEVDAGVTGKEEFVWYAFTVTKKGRLKDIERDGESTSFTLSTKKMLRKTKFRPKFVDGVPVTAKMRLKFIDRGSEREKPREQA